jgi:type III pantothenate kinase
MIRMLLALDAGNTHIHIGLFEGDRLNHRWRLSTVHDRTEDEWGLLLRDLFAVAPVELTDVEDVIISSVVPPLNPTFAAMSRRYLNRDPQFVTEQTDTGLKILYDNPREVGADRIVNGVAALHAYGGPCVVVDLGTAITFDCLSANAEYLGGIICAGIGISIDALYARTAKLPKVDFREPEKLIGTSTTGSIQSGLYHGSIALIDGILDKLLADMGAGTKIVATGGQADLIAAGSRHIRATDPDLTLKGLHLIWRRGRPGAR